MFRKVLIILSLVLTTSMLLSYDSAYTHSGRTDANGGHYNRKTGEYHYHNSGRSRSSGSTNRTTRRTNTTTTKSAALMSYPAEFFLGDTAYPVTRIIDGDTVEIRYDGKLTSVALIGYVCISEHKNR